MTVPDLTSAVWRKASLSESASGCVEVAVLAGLVAVRDSKNIYAPPHIYPAGDWAAFLENLRAGTPCATSRIGVEITAEDVVLTDTLGSAAPHHYTHREWLFFLDGVLKREPQLTAPER